LTKEARWRKNVGNSGRSSGDAGEGDTLWIYKEQKARDALKTNLQIKFGSVGNSTLEQMKQMEKIY
jgi:hypothetical protein